MCAGRAKLALGVLLGLGLWAPMAAGAEAASGVALQTFEDGRRLYEQGLFAEALRSFQASLSLQASPNTRLYIARCYRGVGKVASAHAAFRLASREAEDRVASTADQRYVATGKSASREADELASRVPHLALSLRLSPASADAVPDTARLTIDGEALPRVAWAKDLELDPGPHVIELGGDGVVASRSEIALAEGERRELAIQVRHLATGGLMVRFRSRPFGMAATIDSEPLDLTKSDALRAVRAGRHRVEVSAPGHAAFVWDGPVNDGARVDVLVDLKVVASPPAEASAGTPKWLFFTAAGLAVASAGTGAVLFAHASSRDANEQAKPVAARLEGTRADIQSEATAASVLLAAGGAAALGAAILAFTTRWSAGKDQHAVLSQGGVMWVPRGAAVGVVGRF